MAAFHLNKFLLLFFALICSVSMVNGQQSPYGGVARTIPGKIEVEDFDVGGEGIAYHDTDAANNAVAQGSTIRVDEGVDIHSNGVIGWFKDGEWLEYTVDVTAGIYDISLNLGTSLDNTHLEIYLDDVLLVDYSVPNTGSYDLRIQKIKGVSIPESRNNRILKLRNVNNDYDFDWILFTAAASGSSSFTFNHSIISELPEVGENAVQTLADYDNDGDLDMTIGSQYYGHLYLYVNEGNSWTREWIGYIPNKSLGGISMDVNQDGWVDVISAGVWFRNEHDGKFTRFYYDDSFKTGGEFHDMVAADVDNDKQKDLVGMGDATGFFWYKISADPTLNWTKSTIDSDYPSVTDRVHGGFSPQGIGDLDGDGDADIFRANAWYENQNNGASWIKHDVVFDELFQGPLPYGKSTRSVIVDIDDDGDNDVVFSESDKIYGKIGIIENRYGNGTEWKLTLFPQTAPGNRCSLHGLRVIDFNMDGKLDVLTVDQEDMMETDIPSPRWYMYSQTETGWQEQVLFDIGLGGHDFLAADADQDGDIDVASKVWNFWTGNALGGVGHADYFENQTIVNESTPVRLTSDVENDWTATGAKWEQLGDYIIGGKYPDDPTGGGVLLTRQKYSDFEMVCDVWADYGIDSGLFLRTTADGQKSYQVTIDYQPESPMGGVYLQGINTDPHWDFTITNETKITGSPAFFDANAWSYIWHPNDWNQFRVRIENNPPTIQVWINGWKVNEFTDNQVRLEDSGYIGLQVHPGTEWPLDKLVRFKNLKIYPLGSNPTSSVPVKKNDKIDYFPVPVSNKLNLSGLEIDSQISIYSMEGVKLFESPNQKNTQMTVDVANWPAGVYVVQVKNTNLLYTDSFKIVKK